MTDIYGTIGPSCADLEILKAMLMEGMTGMRINTSHISVKDAAPQIEMIQDAAYFCGIKAKILIDMQGPELRIGAMNQPIELHTDSLILIIPETEINKTCRSFKANAIPVPEIVFENLKTGQRILLDDGKILLEISSISSYSENSEISESKAAHQKPFEASFERFAAASVLRGGLLKGRKSIALPESNIKVPAVTEQDRENISDAVKYGITGVMQPFVRDKNDLQSVRTALNEAGGSTFKVFAKIENRKGVENLETFFGLADEIVIARGDLGNAMPLWELPRVQKEISRKCRSAGVPFMVVTQMLASMENSAVPTRAEVSDIYNAVCDGASSVMVTGETAVGKYPIEVIRFLSRTAAEFHN